MNAIECRIGNFVGLNLKEFEDNYFRIIEVAETNMKVTGSLITLKRGETHFFDAELLEGIPLYGSGINWWEKFGFEWNQKHCHYRHKTHYEFVIVRWDDPVHMVDPLDGGDQPLRVKLEYVHTLQNLYFALKGEDLKFE